MASLILYFSHYLLLVTFFIMSVWDFATQSGLYRDTKDSKETFIKVSQQMAQFASIMLC